MIIHPKIQIEHGKVNQKNMLKEKNKIKILIFQHNDTYGTKSNISISQKKSTIIHHPTTHLVIMRKPMFKPVIMTASEKTCVQTCDNDREANLSVFVSPARIKTLITQFLFLSNKNIGRDEFKNFERV